VISHESLSGSPHAGGFDSRDICRRLSEVFEHPKILIVIREQKSLILSLYYSYLRWGGGLSLKNYLQQPYEGLSPVFDKRNFLFNNLISMYRDAFGKYKVLVLAYEMFKNEPEYFMNRLSGFSGADIPVSLPFKQNANKNRGVWMDSKLRLMSYFFRKTSMNAYSALYLGKVFFKTEKSIRKRLKWMVPEFLDNSLLRKQAGVIEELIGDYYHESNLKTEQLTGLDLKKYSYS